MGIKLTKLQTYCWLTEAIDTKTESLIGSLNYCWLTEAIDTNNWKLEHIFKIWLFLNTIKDNGLVISESKVKKFQTHVRFLGFDIHHGMIKPIDRVIQFADKFGDQT